MEAVDILGDHCPEPSLLLQLCQGLMGPVGLRIGEQHLIPVEPVKFLGSSHIEGVAQNGLRRVCILLVIQTVSTPEIRDLTLGGHACTAKKYDILTLRKPLLQSFAFCHLWHSFPRAEHPKWIPPAPERPLNHLVQKNSVERLDILAVRNVFHLLRQGIPEQPLGQLCDGEHLHFSLGNEPGFLDDLRAALI